MEADRGISVNQVCSDEVLVSLGYIYQQRKIGKDEIWISIDDKFLILRNFFTKIIECICAR